MPSKISVQKIGPKNYAVIDADGRTLHDGFRTLQTAWMWAAKQGLHRSPRKRIPVTEISADLEGERILGLPLGSTAAIGGTATGTNPVTGLPCNGSGSISVSGAGGLPGTTGAPPGEEETTSQIPVGVPPTSSIYSSQSTLGAC